MAVRKRKDRNLWVVDVYVNGKRVVEYERDRNTAKRREKELIAQSLKPEPELADQDITLSQFAVIYLEHARATKAPKTVYEKEKGLRLVFCGLEFRQKGA